MKWQIGNITSEFLVGKQQEYDNPNAQTEENILVDFMKYFNVGLYVEHNSKDYTTLKYKDYDLLRLKFGSNARWVKVFIPTRDRYINDPLFEEHTKKNELYWKSSIVRVQDLQKFINILNEDIEFIDKQD